MPPWLPTQLRGAALPLALLQVADEICWVSLVGEAQHQVLWGGGPLDPMLVLVEDVELHDLAGGACVGHHEVVGEAAEGLVGACVGHPHHGAASELSEVHEHVGTLGRAQQQCFPGRCGGPLLLREGAVARQARFEARAHPHHFGQEALVAADLVEVQLHPGLAVAVHRAGRAGGTDDAERQVEEARAAAVQDSEAVQSSLDLQDGPGDAVHEHDVEECLGIPDGRDIRVHAGVADQRDLQVLWIHLLEEGTVSRIEQRPVLIERPVLDDEGDLVILVPPLQVGLLQGLARLRRRAWQPSPHEAGLAALALAKKPEAGRARIHVCPGHAEGVVVVPHGRGGLVVGVAEVRRAVEPIGPAAQPVDRGASLREALQIARGRHPPRLWVSVAVGAGMGTVHVDHHGYRAEVRLGQPGISHLHGAAILLLLRLVAAREPLGVCPVQRLINRDQVLDETARLLGGPRRPPVALPGVLHEVVDPSDLGWDVTDILHGVGGVVELGVARRGEANRAALEARGVGLWVARRPVAPHRCGVVSLVGGKRLLEDAPDLAVPVAARQDLLLELAHSDLVERRAVRLGQLAPRRLAHDGRDYQGRHVLPDRRCIEGRPLLPSSRVSAGSAVSALAAQLSAHANAGCCSLRHGLRPSLQSAVWPVAGPLDQAATVVFHATRGGERVRAKCSVADSSAAAGQREEVPSPRHGGPGHR
mmetsp:Transcript_87624/g.256174  ORF Transcript_87624/g.256174 Transcript_87624/m.256174 type:complete len:703 (-) Transcript_87624:156-2264(-)